MSERRYIKIISDAVEKLSPILERARDKNLDRNLAVVYLRVSRADEDISNQWHAILNYAKQHNYMIVHTEKDIDVSGTIPPWQRENFLSLLEHAIDMNAGTLLLYDLSRLARNVEWGIVTIYALADVFNIEFVAMKFLEYIQEPELKKKVLLDFLWFAEMYVEDIRRRTKAALERLKAEGKLYHRPRTPIPYDIVEKLRKSGLSWRDIHRVLVSMGYLRYREKGQEKIMSYQWFLRRVKRERSDLF